MTPDEAASIAVARPEGGHRAVWNTPVLLAVVWLAFLANLSAFPLTNGLLPYVAKDVYALGPDRARLSGGELRGRRADRLDRAQPCAAPDVALPRTDDRRRRCVWYALLLAFAQMPGPLSGIRCLVLAGIMQSFCMVPLSIMLLRAAGERFRGRVMGVRMMAIYSLPLGLLAAGPLIDWFGFRATASLYAIVGLVFTLIIALRWRAELWRA